MENVPFAKSASGAIPKGAGVSWRVEEVAFVFYLILWGTQCQCFFCDYYYYYYYYYFVFKNEIWFIWFRIELAMPTGFCRWDRNPDKDQWLNLHKAAGRWYVSLAMLVYRSTPLILLRLWATGVLTGSYKLVGFLLPQKVIMPLWCYLCHHVILTFWAGIHRRFLRLK